MFKFIRKYQKWMLVIFCAGLMFVFVIPQAAQQFIPSGEDKVLGRAYDGQKITHGDQRRAINNLATLRQLGFDGIGLFAQEDSESDAGLAWLLLVRAGEHAGFQASDNEAYSAISMKQSSVTDDVATLDALAAKLKMKRADLLGLVKQFLIAEQYRRLVMGHTYEYTDGLSASPGLRRIQIDRQLSETASERYETIRQFYTENNIPFREDELAQNLLNERNNAMLASTIGRPRISDAAVRHIVQDRQATLGGTLVVFEAEESTEDPTEEQLQSLFDQYKGDFAGSGETYGFGYRQPGQVRIESVRIPFDAVRAIAAGEVSESDVRRYYDDNVILYLDWQPRDQEPDEEEAAEDEAATADPEAAEAAESGSETEADGEAEPSTEGETDTNVTEAEANTDADAEPEADAEPRIDERVRIDYRLREEIRQVLIFQKTNEMMADIVRDIQRVLAEDARVLKEEGGFKVIPDDFVPTSMEQVAARIQEDYGVTLEVIADNGEWVPLPEFAQTASFASGMVGLMPTRTIWMRGGRTGYELVPVPLPTVSLSGRMGLLSSYIPQQGAQGQNRMISIGQLAARAKELQPEGQPGTPQQPQVGLVLPGVTIDATGSAYVSRLTDAERDRPAESLAEVRDEVERDARLLAGYETMTARKESLLTIARETSIFDLAASGSNPQVAPFSRSSAPTIEGVSNTRPLVDAAFELAEELRAGAGVEGTLSADRLIAVELPRERKLLIFQVDAYKPISRTAYQDQLGPQSSLLFEIAIQQSNIPDADPNSNVMQTLSLESMIRHTGFEYAEDEGPTPAEGAGDGSESADE
ncbi:MAG: hypothetical protein AAGA29_06535 [Planctomycetota bacterium]